MEDKNNLSMENERLKQENEELRKQKGNPRKAINFDLDTKKLMAHFGNLYEGYYLIKQFMKKNDFVHVQGSGYVSEKNLSFAKTNKFVKKMVKELPWLKYCDRVIHITNVDKNQYDIQDIAINVKTNKRVAKKIIGKTIEETKEKTKTMTKSKTNKDKERLWHRGVRQSIY